MAACVALAALAATSLVAAPRAYGLEAVDLKFDFGGPATPTADGWTPIHPGSLYTPEVGHGFTDPPNSFRDRTQGTDLMQRDFVIGAPHEFVADLPDGAYEVTAWFGDLIAGNRTTMDIEGKPYSAGTGTGQIHEAFLSVAVSDGQLNVKVTGGDGRLNGLRIQSPLPAVTGLTATVDVEQPSVSLDWDDVSGAAGYVVTRESADAEPAQLGRPSESAFSDDDVEIGETYRYVVTGLRDGRESGAKTALDVAVIDPTVEAPAQPTGLVATDTQRDSISLAWDDDESVTFWKVLRTTRSDIPFTRVATVTEPVFVDDDVLTTRPYLYKVIAVNAGGNSPETDVLTTEVATTLTRQVEELDRAPVAIKTQEGVYLSWRLLGLDDRALGFHVYRDEERITREPISGSTNLLDPAGDVDSVYRVTAIEDGKQRKVTGEFGVWDEAYLDIALNVPAGGTTPDGVEYHYTPGDGSVGDLDGDGQYELVLAWNPSNWKDNSLKGFTGNVYLDAYELDGTQLWRLDLGRNIRAGAHYTQFQVWDLDADGRAEVSMKTADGTIDGVGTVIGDGTADYRNATGYVLTGPEYLTVFDGLTGAALDTVDYVPGRGTVTAWGDAYGNRVDRFLASVAYLDGERPSLIFSRGYYTRTVIAAWDFNDGQLVERWTFDSNEWGAEYEGQGNHSMSVADVDRDGLDEVIFGALTVDDDGSPLYNSRLRHGDALHVGDHDPERAGLEIYSVFEDPTGNGGIGAAMRDAETGEILWKSDASTDIGRGSIADLDPNYPGNEAWHPTSSAVVTTAGLVKTAAGEVITETIPEAGFATWWDGDLLRELATSEFDVAANVGAATMSKWNPETKSAEVTQTFEGLLRRGSKAEPIVQADLFGDWREETILWHEGDPGTIRLITTDIETDHRIPTLMHDSQYRQAAAWQNTAYNQPPHPSFFIGQDMAEPPMAHISYVNAPSSSKPGHPSPGTGKPTENPGVGNR